MSRTTIDERVTKISLDNRDFESNASQSIKTSQRLEDALSFDEAGSGLDKVSKRAREVDLSKLENDVGRVSKAFSALGVIGVSTLDNLVNRAVNAGVSLVKSLSTDNIVAGWEKFGQKTTAVGTLVSQGFQLDDINSELNKLRWYTDETSYKFDAMVSSIAKFTAAGQNLKGSVTALEGIANWAALSGQNAQTAAGAMYQLSQAMGSGVMKRQDWMSVVNANMDTQEFRQKALDAAVALGTLRQNADGTYQSLKNLNSNAFTKNQFIDSLTEGEWFTSDVQMQVYKNYAAAVDDIFAYAEEKGITASQAIEELGGKVDEFGLKAFLAAQEARTLPDALDAIREGVQSGWAETFEIIFGNYEEAKELWTNVANIGYEIFAGGASDRNALLGDWKELGGRDGLLAGVYNLLTAILSLMKPFKDAWETVFPPMTAQTLLKITEGFKTLTENLILSEENMYHIARAARGLFSIFGLITDGIKALGRLISSLFSNVKGAESGLTSFLRVLGDIGDFFTGLRYVINNASSFADVVAYIGHVFKLLGESAKEGLSKFSDVLANFTVNVNGLDIKPFLNIATRLRDIIYDIGNLGTSTNTNVSSIVSFLRDSITEISAFIKEIVTGTDIITANYERSTLKKLLDFIPLVGGELSKVDWGSWLGIAAGAAILAVAVVSMKKIYEDIRSFFSLAEGLGAIAEETANVLHQASKAIKRMSMAFSISTIMNAVNGVLKTIALLGVVFGALAVIQLRYENVDYWAPIGPIITLVAVTTGMVTLMTVVTKLLRTDPSKALSQMGRVFVSLGASAILIAQAQKTLAGIDEDGLKRSVLAMVSIIGTLGGIGVALGALGSDFTKLKSLGATFLSMSVSFVIMAGAVKLFSGVSNDDFFSGFSKITAILVEFAALAFVLKKVNIKGVASSLMSIGVGLLALSAAVLIFSRMKLETIGKGLAAVGVGMISMAAAVKLIGKANLKGVATSMLAMSVSMLALSGAVIVFGNMHTDTLVKGLASVAGLLIGLATAVKIASAEVKPTVLATLVGLVASVYSLYLAVKLFAAMSWEDMGQGLLGVFATMGAVVTALVVLEKQFQTTNVSKTLLSIVAFSTLLAGTMIAVSTVARVLRENDLDFSDWLGPSSFFVALAVAVKIIGSVDPLLAWNAVAVIGAISVLFTAIITILIPLMLSFVGWLDEVTNGDLENQINRAKNIFDSIGQLLGSLYANIVGTYLDKITDYLVSASEKWPQIGANVKGFSDGLQPLFDFLLSIDDGIIEKADTLSNAVLKLTAADFVQGLNNLFFGSKGLFGSKDEETKDSLISLINILPSVGKALDEMSGYLENVDVSKIDAISSALANLVAIHLSLIGSEKFGGGGSLLGIGNSSVFGGIREAGKESDEGLTGIAKFARQLSTVGNDIYTFYESIKSLGDDAKEKAKIVADIVTVLAKAANTIPNDGPSVVSFFVGDNAIDDFGTKLSTFASSIVVFSSILAGGVSVSAGQLSAKRTINDSDVARAEYAADILKSLAIASQSIPNDGPSVVSFFVGDNAIDDFGTKLASFGSSIVVFSALLAGGISASSGALSAKRSITAQDVERAGYAAEIISKFAAVMKDVPESGGMWGGLLTSRNKYQNFASNVAAISSAFPHLSENIKDVDTNALTSINTALSLLSNIIGVSADFDTKKVSDISVSIAELVKSFTTTEPSKINASVTAIKRIFAELTSYISDISSNIFENAIKDVKTGASDILKEVRNLVNDLSIYMRGEGASRLRQDGKFMTQGLVTGLSDSETTSKAHSAARGMANGVIGAFESAAGISSPSARMRDDGVWLVKGLTEGITSDTSAEEAMAKKAQNIISAFESAASDAIQNTYIDKKLTLWDTLYGDRATEEQKRDAQVYYLNEQLADERKRFGIYQAGYKATVAQMGEEYARSSEAYEKMLDSQIKIADLQNQLREAVASNMQPINIGNPYAQDEYNLWLSMNDATLTEGEKDAAWIAVLHEELKTRENEYQEAINQYAVIASQQGKAVAKNTEAYKNVIEAKKNLVDVQNEIDALSTNLTKSNTQALQEAWKSYYAIWQQEGDMLKGYGYSEDRIEAYAREKSGLEKLMTTVEPNYGFFDSISQGIEKELGNVHILEEKPVMDFAEYISTQLEQDLTSSNAVIEFVADTQAKKSAARTSAAYTKAYSEMASPDLSLNLNPEQIAQQFDGIANDENVLTSAQNAYTKLADLTSSGNILSTFKDNGASGIASYVSGLFEGTEQSSTKATQAGIDIGNALRTGTENELEIHSPSKVGYDIGANFVSSIADGMLSKIEVIQEAAKRVSDAMKEAEKKTSTQNSSISSVYTPGGLSGGITMAPSNVGFVLASDYLDSSIEAAKNALSSSDKSTSSSESKPSEYNVYNNFTQNNSSPKALSTADIYRNSQNMFNQMANSNTPSGGSKPAPSWWSSVVKKGGSKT